MNNRFFLRLQKKNLNLAWWLFCVVLVGKPLFCEEPPIKKVLFITDKLRVSGVDQAFISLINLWELKGTQLEIFIKQRGGPIESRLRSDIRVISYKQAMMHTYDVAVCYVEWMNPDACLKKIKAPRKVQWIHTDLLATPYDFPFKQRRFCEGIHAFVCVSEMAAENMRKIHPTLQNKIFVIHNIMDQSLMRFRACEEEHLFPQDGICNVVSVARLSLAKGFDRAIRVHSRLEREGIHFRWYIVGDGVLRASLAQQIKDYDLEGKFILLGQKLNPYPYIKEADIFALTSRFEGCSVAVNEAKILGRPILFTEVAGAREQIESEVNGLIVDNNEEAIYFGFKRLLQDKGLRRRFSEALSNFTYDNQDCYNKVEKILFPK